MELVRNEEKRAEYTKRAKELVSKMTLEEKKYNRHFIRHLQLNVLESRLTTGGMKLFMVWQEPE